MYVEVLSFVAARNGAPVTEIQRAFSLPSEMAASLCIELQDAGLLADQELGPCHHLDDASAPSGTAGGACSGGSCTGGSCSGEARSGGPHDQASEAGLGDFGQGCCGMNSPYRLTERGRAFLLGREFAVEGLP